MVGLMQWRHKLLPGPRNPKREGQERGGQEGPLPYSFGMYKQTRPLPFSFKTKGRTKDGRNSGFSFFDFIKLLLPPLRDLKMKSRLSLGSRDRTEKKLFGSFRPINSREDEEKKKCLAFFFFTETSITWLGRTTVSKSLYYSKSWHIFPCFKTLEIYFVAIVNE